MSMNGVRLVSHYRQIHILLEGVNFQIVITHRFIIFWVIGAVLSLRYICNLYDDLCLFFIFKINAGTLNDLFELVTIPSFTGCHISLQDENILHNRRQMTVGELVYSVLTSFLKMIFSLPWYRICVPLMEQTSWEFSTWKLRVTW
jgi:hypothetical protein